MMLPRKLNGKLCLAYTAETVQYKDLLLTSPLLWKERVFKLGHLYRSFDEVSHSWYALKTENCSVFPKIYTKSALAT